LKSKYQQWA
jgi:aryl carrier-like protein